MNLLIVFIFNLCLIIGIASGTSIRLQDCTYQAQISPCRCSNNSGNALWSCGSDTIEPTLFAKLSQIIPDNMKNISSITLSGTNIEVIPANLFGDLKFTNIRIQSMKQLRHINSKAFTGQDPREFALGDLPRLQHTDGNTTFGTNIFKIINGFKSVETLYLSNFSLPAIPANAFMDLAHLTYVAFYGESIKTVGDKAFYAPSSLKYLHLTDTGIEKLSANALLFGSSQAEMILDLQGSPYLNNKKFADNALGNFRAKTTLRIWPIVGDKTWSTIDESIFRPFFASNEHNKVIILGATFNCNDPKNAWLKSEPKLLNKVYAHREWYKASKDPINCE